MIIGVYFKQRKPLLCALLLGLAIGLIGGGMQHVSSGDLSRYAAMVASYEYIPFDHIFQTALGNYYLSAIWFWLIAQTGYPPLLQVTSVFVEYAILAYLLFDYAEQNHLKNSQVILGCFLILCLIPFFFSVSALRSTPTLLIGVLAIYLELYKGKRNIWVLILYIAPCFIHSTGFALLTCRLLYGLLKDKPSFGFGLTVVAIPLLVSFSNILSPITSLFNVNIIDMLVSYSEWSGGYAADVSNNAYYLVVKLVNSFFIIGMTLDLLFSKRFQKGEHLSDSDQKLRSFLLITLGLIFGSLLFIQVPSYLRFTYAFYPIGVLLIIKYRFSSNRYEIAFSSKYAAGLKPVLIQGFYLFFAFCFLALHVVAFFNFVNLPLILQSTLFGILAPAL